MNNHHPSRQTAKAEEQEKKQGAGDKEKKKKTTSVQESYRPLPVITKANTRTMLRVYTFICLLLAVSLSLGGAFVSPSPLHKQALASIAYASPSSQQASFPLLAVKKSNEDEETNSSVQFLKNISPLNPYMWAVYFFVFIYAVDAFKLGPHS